MASLTTNIYRTPSRTSHGIGCILLGMCFFAGQDAMMKSLLDAYPIWVLMFIRSCVAIAMLVPSILILGAPHRLKSAHWRLHSLRAVLFATGFSLFYAAFPFMGLAEVTTIFFSAPLMIALMAAIFLKESIGLHRIGALVVGFVGVLIAMKPGGESFSWIAILPLLCAVCYAATQILARQIGETESSLTVGLWTLSLAGPVVLVMGFTLNQVIAFEPEYSHLSWGIPNATQGDLLTLLLLGLVGMAGYTLLSRAYQVAEASIIAPFDYSYLPIAVVMGWWLWGEVPPITTFVGMVLIAASGLYIAYRELRAERSADDQTFVAENVTVPGTYHAVQTPDDSI